ncbi:hypothetical protein [Streptomyces sp. NPDC059893]|uniref:hypothetical protein n=1 Tax=Streptomyces sp. NPDC059893 TaxID=3346990 RepID=UPI00364C34B0
MVTLDRISADQGRDASEKTQRRNEETTAWMNRAAGLEPNNPTLGTQQAPLFGDGDSAAKCDVQLPRMDFGNRTESDLAKGTDLTYRETIDVSAGIGESPGKGSEERPTLPDHFDQGAGLNRVDSVDLTVRRLDDARLDVHLSAIDPVQLHSDPLAPESMTVADPTEMASFMTNSLRV